MDLLTVLTKQQGLASQYLAELRHTGIQNDRLRFNYNLKRLGFLLSLEASKQLNWQNEMVKTPLATTQCQMLSEQPILLTILRAGLPLLEGGREAFDKADVGFVGAYRSHAKDAIDFEIELEYLATPSLTGKQVLIYDPMLATGRSLADTITLLQRERGTPSKVIILAAIAAPEGIQHIHSLHPDVCIITGAVDEGLDHRYYIVPGLGDAGDLAFGSKV